MYAHLYNQHICKFNCPFCPNIRININVDEYDNNKFEIIEKLLKRMKRFSETNVRQCKDHFSRSMIGVNVNKKEDCKCPFCGVFITPQSKMIYIVTLNEEH